MKDDNTQETWTVDDDDTAFEQFADIDDPETDTEDDSEPTQEAGADTELSDDDAEQSFADADSDDEDHADDADDDEDTAAFQSPDDSVIVQMPGGEKITLGELKKGNLRQSDYTRKRQEESVAHQRAAQLSQVYEQQVQHAMQIAQAFMPRPPDPQLLEYDTTEYLRQKNVYEQATQHLNQVSGGYRQHQRMQSQQAEHQKQATIAVEQEKLLALMPELKSAQTRQKVQAELADGLKAYGFEASDLADVYDHRVIQALVDANKWRKSQAQKGDVRKKVDAKAEKARPVAKPKRTSKSTRKGRSPNELVKLANGGNEAAADALFMQFAD